MNSSARHKSRTQAFLEKVGLREQDPGELLKEWTRKIRKEQRAQNRQLLGIEREEIKMKRDLKNLAKKGENAAIRPLATALVQSKQAKSRILVSKANMNSVLMEMRHQTAQLKMVKCIQGSTKVMKSMNSLMNTPGMSNTFHELAVEMEKAGLIQETMDDAFDLDEDIEMEADEEVDKVIAELTLGILNDAPTVPIASPKNPLAETGKMLFQQSLSGGVEDKHVLIGTNSGKDDLDRRLEALQT